MNRTRLNLLVDLLAMLTFMAVLATGLVLQNTLPAGSGRLDAAGCLPDREVLVLWGLDRHQWGRIHQWASWSLIGVLIVHLALHARWLALTLSRQAPSGGFSSLRLGLGLSAGLALGVTVALALSTPQRVARAPAPNAEGAELYRRECQACHAHPGRFQPWPDQDEAALERLRMARPPGPHTGLQRLSASQLGALLRYLREQKE